MELGLVAQRGNDRAVDLADDLVEALGESGVTVRLDESTATTLDESGYVTGSLADCPLVVSIGGDGTFLYTARNVGSTPVLGVNLGEVGFLNAVSPGEALDRIREEIDHIRETGEPRYREVPRLAVTGMDHSPSPALNEIVVQGPQRGRGNGADLTIRIDGSEYVTTHADGVLVATQTGSTAYNLSEGGPLVHPTASGIVVTAMCSTEAAPSLVVGTDCTIEVEAEGTEEVVLASDGSERRWVDAPTTVTIGVADEPGRIAGPRSDFFRALSKIG